MHIHGRKGVLLGALVAALALVVPTTAFASHDLGIYKAEKHLDIESDEVTYDLSCKSGDYALDGMWRIDHADQDDDDLYRTSLGRAIDVLEAYPTVGGTDTTSGHRDTYHFRFEKNAIGRVQLKVWTTCIKQDTEKSGGHDHALQVTNFKQAAKTGSYDTSTANEGCPSKQFISTPGFKINFTPDSDLDPTPYMGHLFKSIMSTNMRDWSWEFDLSQDSGAPTVDYYYSCVNRKVVKVDGENHKLIYKYQDSTQSLTAKKTSTVRESCKSHYKAVIAGFDATSSLPTGSGRDPNPDFSALVEPWVWFLGMDPQIKARDFKFLNNDSSSHSVDTAAICLNYRTT